MTDELSKRIADLEQERVELRTDIKLEQKFLTKAEYKVLQGLEETGLKRVEKLVALLVILQVGSLLNLDAATVKALITQLLAFLGS